MFCQSLIAITVILAAAVLPTPNRPRTERLSRGPAWTSLQNLAIDQPAIVAAKQLRGESRRIAVMGVNAAEQPAVDAMADLIRSGLMFGKGLIVTDMATSERLFNAAVETPAIREVASVNDIDIVVRVKINIDNDSHVAKLEVISKLEKTSTILQPINLPNLDAAVIGAAVVARKSLLENLEAVPETHVDQLDRVPQASLKSILEFLAAKRMLMSVIAAEDKQGRERLCRDALSKIDNVLATSPEFLEAYLLKASCQDELDQTLELKQTLTTAYQKSDPEKQNQLTLQELKGDYSRFVQADASGGLDAYLELLNTDPTNLTGLWGMIDILLTGDGTTEPDEATIREAAEIAALLLAAHPQSGVAIAIAAQSK